MYRLRTLGGLGLERGGVPQEDLAAQRKSLVLLALVSLHDGVGRERLMALLWPESSTERARGSLKQSVHQLRRLLDAPDLFLGTAELRLNPDRIECDARLFLAALAADDPGSAVELYRGPFLQGVHLDGAGEFDQWATTEREMLARRHREALEALARKAARSGDLASEVGWWRRLQGVDPLNTPVALTLIDALHRAGDRAGALRHGRVHEILLREELGLEPGPEFRRALERLRRVDPDPGVPGSIPPVEQAAEVAATAVVLPGPPPPLASPGPRSLRPPRSGSRGWRLRVPPLVVAAGLVALAAWFSRGEGGAGTGAEAGVGPWPSDAISIAVLPFVDMSPDGSLEHWADGVAEEILNTLAGIREIRVPARTSSFHFKGRSVPVRQIAELLGVNHVLEGSVRASGDRLRFTAQLIDARDDRHLWSATFDSEDDDVFAVEAEIARTVAAALRVELGLAPAPPPSPGAEAHELYLRGLFHWHRRSAPDLLMALRHFEEATRLEPSYARPWAGLALVYAVVPINFVPTLPIPEARVRLETVARTALELDPSLAEVHAALGLGYHFDWRWEDAEREFLRALELNPRLATARQWYAEHLAKTGRGALALEQVERALELDPLSLVIRSDIGLIHFINGDFAPARAQWERVLADDPAFILPHFFLHRLDLLEGDLVGAEEWGRRWAGLTGVMGVEEVTLLTRAVGDPALRPSALALLDGWESGPGARWLDLAFYRIQLGEVEGAIRALERGAEARAPMMVQIVRAPWFDPLRGEPGFEQLLLQVAPWASPGTLDGSTRPWPGETS